jgi:predicted nucleic acid-binding protein
VILVDTSVWIDHLRKADSKLAELLNSQQVLCHPMIIGEIALGGLKQRTLVLEALQNLPQVIGAGDDEVLAFITTAKLAGKGIGYLDAHLLAAAKLTDAQLWTRDKSLAKVAEDLGLGWG